MLPKTSTQAQVKPLSQTERVATMSGDREGNASLDRSGNGCVAPENLRSEFGAGSEQVLRACIANSPVVLYSIDRNGIFTLLEGKGLEVCGLKADQVVGKSIYQVFSDYPGILANIHRTLSGEEVNWTGEIENYMYENRSIPLRGTTGEVIGLVGMAINITRKTKAEEQLRLLAAAVEHAEDSILITSTNLTAPGPEIVFVNKAFTKMTGYSAQDVLGRSPRILQGPKTDRAVLERLLDNLREGQIFFGEAINYRKDGSEFYNEWHIEPIRDASNEVSHYLAIQRDVTQRKQAEAKLEYAAFYDPLTNLPNRTGFINRLHTCIERAQQSQDFLFAVLFFDLDRFKVINDSLGHKAGDQMLVAIANRLKAAVKPGDTVARVGGDEFAILLENLTDIGHVSRIANWLQTELRQPLQLEGQEVLTTASIGIAVSMLWYDCPEDILRDAEIAGHRAKALGKARSVVFNKTMHRHAVNRLQLETDLRRAISQQELRLYYQPIVSLTTGQITGFEALVRWQHPTRGLVSPAEFIPVAEETGLIVPIGEWVLREACITAKKWQQAFPNQKPLTMSVNLSGRQFVQPDLIEKIDRILRETDLQRETLKLEITESAIMEDAESPLGRFSIESAIPFALAEHGCSVKRDTSICKAACTSEICSHVAPSCSKLGGSPVPAAPLSPIMILEQLRSLGVQLGIDDFGTGYSSLSRLYRFPINTLKIDRSFIKRMEVGCEGKTSTCSCTIVRTIITLAHNLGLDVTAEGIETPEQLADLRKLGCEFGQGYLFSKPVDAAKAEALIAAQPRW
jgi:diguanylate cyclase (GGDEF)-like protein/PAS domain S-box-containing protein